MQAIVLTDDQARLLAAANGPVELGSIIVCTGPTTVLTRRL
jgi:hypothetical protein